MMYKNFADGKVNASEIRNQKSFIKSDSSTSNLSEHELKICAYKQAIELKTLELKAAAMTPPITKNEVLQTFGMRAKFQSSTTKTKDKSPTEKKAKEKSTKTKDKSPTEKKEEKKEKEEKEKYEKKKTKVLVTPSCWNRTIEIASKKQEVAELGITLQDVKNHGELKDIETWEQALGEAKDNHHSPLTPKKYVRFRLEPEMKFYRSKLPAYANNRAATQILTVLASLVGAVLSFMGASLWVGVLSCSSAAVVAWSDFSGTDKKMQRYSTAVAGLTSIQLWWNALPEVEQLATKNIDFLVESVEGVIRTERQGWVSSSESTKRLKEDMNNLTKRLKGEDIKNKDTEPS